MEFNATFIVSAISFTMFTILMNAIFYKPMQKIVLERQKFIDETYEEAKLNKEKSQAILNERNKQLEKTKHDAKKIILDKSNDSKAQKLALATEAQDKAFQRIDLAKGDLLMSKNEAQAVLTDNVVSLAQDISSKILGENISIDNVDKDFINKSMGEG